MSDQFLIKKNLLIQEAIIPGGFYSSNGEKFIFKFINDVSKTKLLEIRNAPHVLENTRFPSPISFLSHEKFLSSYSELPRLDLVCLSEEDLEPVGVVNLVKSDYGFELGKYIGNKNYLNIGLAFPMSRYFIDFILKEFTEISKISAVTKITNFKNINLNFKLGFKIESLVRSDYWLMRL